MQIFPTIHAALRFGSVHLLYRLNRVGFADTERNMTVSTFIEILAAVFIVFGVYSAVRILVIHLVFSCKTREGVCLAVICGRDDEPEEKELRLMYAERLSRELFACRRIIMIDETQGGTEESDDEASDDGTQSGVNISGGEE